MELTPYSHGDTVEHDMWPSPGRVYDRLDAALAAQHLAAYAVETPDGRSRIWCIHDPSGQHTGTYLQEARSILSKAEGRRTVESFERLSRFIAWRPERISSLRPNAAGHPRPEGGRNAEFIVEWFEPNGDFRTPEPVDGVISTSVAKVRAMLGASAGLPIQRGDEKMLDNALTLAGLESQTRTERLLQPGWVWTGGRWVFAAPQGSVDAQGLADTVTPLGATGLPARDEGTDIAGWSNPLDSSELRAAAISMRDFVDLARTRSTSLFLLLLAFAAPLQLTTRSGAIIKAFAGSGKTLLLTRLALYFAPFDGRAARYPVAIPDATKSGISALMGWARGLVVIADDLRSQGVSADRVAAAHGVVEQAAQMAYGSGVSAKANPDGTLRDTARRSEATLLIAGEELPGAAAISGRLNILFLGENDVATTSDQGPPAIDSWFDQYGRTGLASGVYADYLSWLAEQMDQHGQNGLTQLRQTYDAEASDFANKAAGGREREIVGPAAAAWVAMQRWAEDRGFANLLPDAEEVARLLEAQPLANRESTEEVSDHRELLTHVQLMLQSRRGHFETQDGMIPQHAERLGWVQDDRSFQRLDPSRRTLVRSRTPLGLLSADENYVTLHAAGLRHIWTQEMKRSSRFRREDVEERLGDLVPVEAQRKKKVPTRFVNGGKSVGIVIDIRKAFPGLLPDTRGEDTVPSPTAAAVAPTSPTAITVDDEIPF